MYKVEERINWIQKKVKEANANGVIVALSGGIDSAVTATLAKKAFPDNMMVLWMGIDSSTSANGNSERMNEFLGVESVRLDLTKDFNSLVETTFEGTDYQEANNIDLIKGNLKARLRMSILYAWAQKKNYLVLETTNKSEDLIGYYTKWGDGAGDICAISDLWKSEVYGLAKELNIPEEIIGTPPSADLWDGQTDEDELGFTYNDIELYANNTLENEEIKTKIKSMVERNSHKPRAYRFGEDK